MVVIGLRPGFHYTANATTTTQKQSDYKVEQSSFALIALFWFEIGRCRSRNWLYGNQALKLLLMVFRTWYNVKILAFEIKQYELTVFLFMTSNNTCTRGFFQLKNENPILSKNRKSINMCQHPAHQVSVFWKGVLCAPDYSKFFETPCI